MQKSRKLIQNEVNTWTKVENKHDGQKYTTPLKKKKRKHRDILQSTTMNKKGRNFSVYLAAIVQDEYFPVLKRRHCSSISVQVRI